MRAIRYHRHGGVDVLDHEGIETPVPRDDELLIEVRACSVNPLDTYFREGETHAPVELPTVPGSDFAGTVVEVGGDVNGFEVGDRVLGAGLSFHRGGAYAEYTVAPPDAVAILPDDVTYEEGAAIGHVGVTAWQSIVRLGAPEPTETCLIHGGSGGVGHVAVQIAKVVGADVIATAGSSERRERIRELGGDVVLDYGRDDLREAIEVTAGNGVAVTLDHRPADYLELDIDVAAPGGRIVLIDGYDVRVRNLRATRRKDLTIHNTGALSSVEDVGTVLGKLGGLLARGDLHVDVYRTYPLERAAEAQRALVEERFVGKIVLVPR